VTLPAGACDAHAHVFAPSDRFPPAGDTAYPPPHAPFDRYRDTLAAVGMQRGVLVQPAVYGTDVRALCDALTRGRGWLRGIGTATSAVTDSQLHAMHDAGIRGLRFVEMKDPRGGGRYAGSIGVDELTRLAPRLRELGWHAQIWASADDHVRLLPTLTTLRMPIVLDHMGSFAADRGIEGTAFERLVSHLAAGEIWIKLSLCRNSRQFPDYPDIRAFHDRLVSANPSRLLWGSDWPHVRMGDLSPDVGHLLALFLDWVGDHETCRRILVDNPHALFHFDAVRPLWPNDNRPFPERPHA
jgi:predicted TIM-barrel fold metal-dependent hydrolase